MIDLKTKGLPNAIEVNGKPFLINTDFRVWLSFAGRMEDARDGKFAGYAGLFAERAPMPTKEVIAELERFYNPEREIPRTEGGGEKLLDTDIDADYIYAAFLQVYGIDLTITDMHWYKFSALLFALPPGTMLTEIIGYRNYEGSSKDPAYKEHMKLKAAWALPQKVSKEEQKAMEEFNKLFG